MTPPTLSLSGMTLLNDPRQNRGTAFTTAERRILGLEGLLPSRVETFSDQKKRIEHQISEKQNDLERYIYLQGLLEKNETLFYSILASDPQRYVPIIYAPTLATVCLQFSQIYRRPHGMYITIEMKGRIAEVLRNWPERDVRTICVTTGGRILGLGDIGANGMGIPIGKLQIYTACGAVPPESLLPIQLDIGTTNAALHEDPFYLGLRRMPPVTEELDEFVEEFMNAVQEVFPGCCVHFEDWKGTDALRYLAKYKDKSLCYNDDIQGTAAVTLAGILTALRISRQPLQEQRILFFGAGASALGCADLLVSAFMNEGLSEEEACSRLVMMDIDGLICKSRTDLLEEQRRYAFDGSSECSLIEVIRKIRPTILIGVSTAGGTFTRQVIEEMCKNTERPIVFPLSIPRAECTAEEAYDWSKGRVLYAAGVQFPAYTMSEGQILRPGQANNFYIFPGLGLAVYAARPRIITNELIIESARALADQTGEAELEQGQLYPSQSMIGQVSFRIAERLASFMFNHDLAQERTPENIGEFIKKASYSFEYSQ